MTKTKQKRTNPFMLAGLTKVLAVGVEPSQGLGPSRGCPLLLAKMNAGVGEDVEELSAGLHVAVLPGRLAELELRHALRRPALHHLLLLQLPEIKIQGVP